jgi:hypothetical protein
MGEAEGDKQDSQNLNGKQECHRQMRGREGEKWVLSDARCVRLR